MGGLPSDARIAGGLPTQLITGYSDLGRQAIAKMNELGVALDLSHSNTKTTADGIAASKKPPLITHAGCRAVYMHPRNKEDREMKALADKGGVMGIYMLPYLTASPKQWPAIALCHPGSRA